MDVADKALIARLDVCADRAGGKRALAATSQISEAQLYRYVAGDSIIPTDRLLAIAEAARVDPNWLLTGKGTLDGPAPRDPRPPFRPDLLTQIIQVFEEAMLEYEKRLSPRQRSRLLTFAYQAFRHEETRQQTPLNVAKLELMGMLDFLVLSPVDENLDIHHLAMNYLEAYDPLPPEWDKDRLFGQWAQIISRGYRQYYNQTGGQLFFEVVGFEVGSAAAHRLNATMQTLTQGQPRPMTMLDLGCGNGRELAFLLHHYPWLKGEGLELSEAGVALAKTLENAGKLPRNSVQQGDMHNLPYANENFDFIYCRQALYATPFLPNTRLGAAQALKEMARVLKPGGIINLSSLRGEGRSYLPFRQYYSREIFDQLLAVEPSLTLTDWQEPTPPQQVWHPTERAYTKYFIATLQKAG